MKYAIILSIILFSCNQEPNQERKIESKKTIDSLKAELVNMSNVALKINHEKDSMIELLQELKKRPKNALK